MRGLHYPPFYWDRPWYGLKLFIINDITKSNPTIDIDRIPDEIVIQRSRRSALLIL